MSWDFLIASIIADVIVKRRERKRQRRNTDTVIDSTYRRASAASQRLFLRSRNKSVIGEYRVIPKERFDHPNLFPKEANVKDTDYERLRYHYFKLRVNLENCDYHAELAHHLLHIWYEDANPTVLPLLQNELLYIIEHVVVTTIEGRLYQHLAMFLSAQCFFFQGDFVNAIKRYYQALGWLEVYQNIERDDFITNGLEYFTEAIIANVVNIFALYGLPEKSDEVRKACNAAVADAQRTDYQLLANPESASIRTYIKQCMEVLSAREKFTGFYVLDDRSYKTGNMLKESLTAIIGGEGLFNISPSLYHISEMTEPSDKLCIPWLTPIVNLPEIISSTREEIKCM